MNKLRAIVDGPNTLAWIARITDVIVDTVGQNAIKMDVHGAGSDEKTTRVEKGGWPAVKTPTAKSHEQILATNIGVLIPFACSELVQSYRNQ